MEINEIPDTIDAPAETSDIGTAADYLQQSLDKTRPKVEQLKALRAPAGDQAVADRLRTTYDHLRDVPLPGPREFLLAVLILENGVRRVADLDQRELADAVNASQDDRPPAGTARFVTAI